MCCVCICQLPFSKHYKMRSCIFFAKLEFTASVFKKTRCWPLAHLREVHQFRGTIFSVESGFFFWKTTNLVPYNNCYKNSDSTFISEMQYSLSLYTHVKMTSQGITPLPHPSFWDNVRCCSCKRCARRFLVIYSTRTEPPRQHCFSVQTQIFTSLPTLDYVHHTCLQTVLTKSFFIYLLFRTHHSLPYKS